jgi:excisionase family DNA binding protein
MPSDSDDLLTSKEVARMLRVSTDTVGRWVRNGQLEAIRLPSGQIRIRREDVERFTKRQSGEP